VVAEGVAEKDVFSDLENPFGEKGEKDEGEKDEGVEAIGSEEAPKGVADIPEPETVSPKPPEPEAGKPKVTQPKKRARKPLTAREKVLRVIMRRADIETAPTLAELMRGKEGVEMRICDIGLFIGDPEDEVLAAIAAKCSVKNRVNLSAEVQVNQMKKVGADILSSGRMYQPIQVADIDGAFECTSGRHRLAFLALLYGVESKIPVYVEEMTIQEARDAVVVANQARPTKALERAEHAILKAVHGDVDADQDQMYEKAATTKAGVKKYCVYSVMERGYPVSLGFKVSLTASRKGGAMTTVTNVENFWSNALSGWHREMPRPEFDGELKAATEFLNAMVSAMAEEPGFDPKQHLAAMPMAAVGKYYNELQNVTGSAIGKVGEISRVIIGMGECGRHKSDVIYHELSKVMRGK
jgi:hypothetical protein